MENTKARFINWCEESYIEIDNVKENQFLVTNFGKILMIEDKPEYLVDKDCCLVIYEEESKIIESGEIDYLVFEFGNRFYYNKIATFKDEYNEIKYKADFNDFKSIGKCTDPWIEQEFVHLGIHTEYELLNGSHNSNTWTKKIKFLNQKSSGICDLNTLAGTLGHQLACNKEGIKSIIGMTISVAHEYDETVEIQSLYQLKLYAKNYKGWQNLLRINKAINVDYDRFIPKKVLYQDTEGLILVINKESFFNKIIQDVSKCKSLISEYNQNFENLYYQIDTVEFYDDKDDINYLQTIKTYLKEYLHLIKPVLINDSYYLEKEMFQLKEYLNKVDKKVYNYSEEEHYKTVGESFNKLSELFTDSEMLVDLFDEMCKNTVEISNLCDFEIEIGNPKLPKYEFLEGKDNVDLFFELIQKGLIKHFSHKENLNAYVERIEIECDVIVSAGFVDYFLILWDIVKWAKSENIYIGTGRGSVAGSLTAMCLDITTIDPIENDLLFERFLNAARVVPEKMYEIELKKGSVLKIKQDNKIKLFDGRNINIELLQKNDKIEDGNIVSNITITKIARKDSMPDVDLDFEADKRDLVKEYISKRFGEYHTCSIGSYTRLKLKAGIKDFGRVKGLTFKAANIISSFIDNQIEYTWKDFIKYSIENPELQDFIQYYPDLAMLIKYGLGQCRSASIHASAVIIVPKKDKEGNDVNIFNWLPIRKIDGKLVSEWEGKYTDMGGFLKEDILGLTQLDKFKNIIKLVKQNTNKKLVLEKIRLTDENTYKLFHKGYNEDVFQFNSSGLKSYSTKVKPDNIEELTAMNALYRPGPMVSNAHTDFALIKHGKKKVQYDYLLQEVTKNTHGLYVYQEQIMKAVVVLGGFSLVQSDEIRTIIKKFDKAGMKKVEQQFIIGAIKKGCEKEEAEKIWNKLVAFSGYGFNKSHSYAYSVMSYWAQYLKCNYSLEFWTTALQFSKEEDIPKCISELRKLKQGITVKPPDVNYSSFNFECNKDTQSVYWSMGKIKSVGDIAVLNIINERDSRGVFKGYDDFVKRVPKNKVNKRVIYNLILAGAFDEIECLKTPKERLSLIMYHYSLYNEELPDEFKDEIVDKSYFWIFKQRELTGFGNVDYKSLLISLNDKKAKKIASMYIEPDLFLESKKDYREVCICGTIVYMKERKSKRGEFLVMTLLCNDDQIMVNVWNDEYLENDEFFASCLNKEITTIAITGKIKFDTWKSQNVLNSYDKTVLLAL